MWCHKLFPDQRKWQQHKIMNQMICRIPVILVVFIYFYHFRQWPVSTKLAWWQKFLEEGSLLQEENLPTSSLHPAKSHLQHSADQKKLRVKKRQETNNWTKQPADLALTALRNVDHKVLGLTSIWTLEDILAMIKFLSFLLCFFLSFPSNLSSFPSEICRTGRCILYKSMEHLHKGIKIQVASFDLWNMRFTVTQTGSLAVLFAGLFYYVSLVIWLHS